MRMCNFRATTRARHTQGIDLKREVTRPPNLRQVKDRTFNARAEAFVLIPRLS
jgi:hypothetical protein